MAITVEATDAATAGTTQPIPLTLPSTEGQLQVVSLQGRTSSTTPSIDGDGWSDPVLIETEIANSSARRQIAVWWRIVPAEQSGTITVSWSASTTRAAIAYELSTNTAGGTWSKDSHADTDNGTSGTTSLASGSAAPAHAEAITIYMLVARHGDVAAEASYSNDFTIGPAIGSTGGAAANNCSGFSGHKIASGTQTTTASWDTSALATGLILAFSVSSGGGGADHTGSAALTIGGVSTSASASFDPGTFTASSTLAVGGAESEAAGTHVAPTFSGTSSLTVGGVELDASATHTAPTFSAAAPLVVGGISTSASATHVAPEFTASAALNTGGVVFSSSGTFAAEGSHNATAGIQVGGVESAASATFDPGEFSAAAGLTVGGTELSAAGTHQPPVFSSTAELTVGGIGASSTASTTAPEFTAAVAIAVGGVELASEAEFTDAPEPLPTPHGMLPSLLAPMQWRSLRRRRVAAVVQRVNGTVTLRPRIESVLLSQRSSALMLTERSVSALLEEKRN